MIIITSCIFLQDDSIVVNRSFEVPNPVVENSISEEPIDHNPVKEYQNVDNGSKSIFSFGFWSSNCFDFICTDET
jgi:hypothetical protein